MASKHICFNFCNKILNKRIVTNNEYNQKLYFLIVYSFFVTHDFQTSNYHVSNCVRSCVWFAIDAAENWRRFPQCARACARARARELPMVGVKRGRN